MQRSRLDDVQQHQTFSEKQGRTIGTQPLIIPYIVGSLHLHDCSQGSGHVQMSFRPVPRLGKYKCRMLRLTLSDAIRGKWLRKYRDKFGVSQCRVCFYLPHLHPLRLVIMQPHPEAGNTKLPLHLRRGLMFCKRGRPLLYAWRATDTAVLSLDCVQHACTVASGR